MSCVANMLPVAADTSCGAADTSHAAADMSRVAADMSRSAAGTANFTALTSFFANFFPKVLKNWSSCQKLMITFSGGVG